MALSCQITHVLLSNAFASSTEHITHVKLSSGTIETREQAVKYIDTGYEYYYTTSTFSKAIVETVHPSGRPAYIRTKGNYTTADNLLSLPRF